MSLLASFVFGIGPVIGKALLKELLKDYPVLNDLGPELLGMLSDKATSEHTRRADADSMGVIGETVARPCVQSLTKRGSTTPSASPLCESCC